MVDRESLPLLLRVLVCEVAGMVTDSSEWWWRCCCRLIAEKLAVVTVDLFELRRDGSKLTVREFQWIVKNVATKMMMVCENSGAARDLVHERLLQWW